MNQGIMNQGIMNQGIMTRRAWYLAVLDAFDARHAGLSMKVDRLRVRIRSAMRGAIQLFRLSAVANRHCGGR
jgi:hypothetical protein